MQVAQTRISLLTRWQSSKIWVGPGIWAIADQGQFAASNFAFNVLLAKWLVPSEFGLFALTYSALLLVGTVHTSLIVEPMLIFGSGRYGHQLRQYFAAILRGHAAFSLVVAVALGFIALSLRFAGAHQFAAASMSGALAAPFVFLLWVGRRACYVVREPRLAAAGGFFYMVATLVGGYALGYHGMLTAPTALAWLATVSLGSSAWLFFSLRRRIQQTNERVRLQVFLLDHWVYGRWALFANAMAWFPGSISLFFLSWRASLASAGVLKALMNLVLPVMHVNAALATLLVPSLVRLKVDEQFGATLRATTLVVAGTCAGYWVMLAVFHKQIVRFVYGDLYLPHSGLLLLLGALPLMSAISMIYGAAIRSLERPDRLALAQAMGATTAIVLGYLAVIRWDLLGAIVGTLSGYTVAATASWRSYKALRNSISSGA